MSDPIRMNAHVRITRNDEGVVSLLVNGEEMNMQVLKDSVCVTFPDNEADYGTGTAYVTMTVATTDYEIDLPAEVEIR